MERRKLQVMSLAVGAAALIGAVALTLWLMRPPAARQVVVPVDPNAGWEAAYATATSNLGTMEKTTWDRQAFVDRYPRAPGTLVALNQLGGLYAREGKFDESVRAYEAARKLAASGTSAKP